MEITRNEEFLSSEGIVFSTKLPYAPLIEEGTDGGPYVCNALLTDCIMLQIAEITDDDYKPIILNGKPVERIEIDSYIDDDEDRISSHKCISICFEGCDDAFEYTSLHSDKYKGLCLDTQAKLFFADILKAYLKEKK